MASCSGHLSLSICLSRHGQPPPFSSQFTSSARRRGAVVSRRADASSWPLDLEAEGSLAGVDVGAKKTGMEPPSPTDPGFGKEKLRAAPRSPARRKTQTAPPTQPPPLPPPPPPREEPLWGSLSLNKCLVVASLVALLGSGFQQCREAVISMASAPAAIPSGSTPKKPEAPAAPVLQETKVPLPPSPVPAAELEEQEDAKGRGEAAEKEDGDIADPAPPLALEPKEKRKKEQKTPRRERTGQEKPRRDSGLRKERARAAREPQKAREGDPRPQSRAVGDPEPRKRPVRASRHQEEEGRYLGRKHRVGKGRD